MSIYNEKHTTNNLKLHIFTPKTKKTELKLFSKTGYSTNSYSACGRTKTTHIYIDKMILCGCNSLITKMIYLFKKNKKSQTKVIENSKPENTQNNDNEIKLNIDLSLLNAPLISDNAEDVYLRLGG